MTKSARYFWAAIQIIQSRRGHVSTGVAMFGALAWFLWPGPDWNVEPEPGLALALATLAWIFSLTGSENSNSAITNVPKLSEHDVELLSRLRNQLTEQTRNFLRDQDFGQSFAFRNLNPIHDLAETWIGSDYEFDNAELSELFLALLERARTFSRKISLDAFPFGAGERASVVPDRERADDIFSDKTLSKIASLNDLSSELYNDIDVFLKKSRQMII